MSSGSVKDSLRAEMRVRRRVFEAGLRAEMRRRECLETELRAIRAAMRRLPPGQRPIPTCFSLPATAKRLGIGLAQLKTLVKTRAIFATKVGTRVVVTVSEIQRAEAMLSDLAKSAALFPRAAPRSEVVAACTAVLRESLRMGRAA